MPRAVIKDNSRVALRIRPDDKAVIARAVALEQTDLTEFIVRTALREARAVIEAYEQVKLSKRDSLRVLQALENPPAPMSKTAQGSARHAGTIMSLPDWHEEPIGKRYDRESFDCGEAELNDFLRRHARQSHDRDAAKTFLAVSDLDGAFLGYYSLCPASLVYARVPEIIRKGLARHDVPVFRLGRLAVDRIVQNKGLGGQLLLAAGRRCLLAAAEVGGVAMLIDAKTERAADWYASCGAIPLVDAPLTLLLPLATVHAALKAAGKL